MKSSKNIILAATVVAGAVAFFVSSRKKKNAKALDFSHFKKNKTPYSLFIHA